MLSILDPAVDHNGHVGFLIRFITNGLRFVRDESWMHLSQRACRDLNEQPSVLPHDEPNYISNV
jgi:hypothetical protein